MQYISSKDNAFYKKMLSLLTPKGRKEHGLFLMESFRFSDISKPEMLIVCENTNIPDYVINRYADIPDYATNRYADDTKIYCFSKTLFTNLSQTITSQGVIAVYKIPIQSEISGFTLVLDGVMDPGNVGTIVRTAAASGVQTVVLTKGSADPFSPKVVRSTAGSVLAVNLIRDDSESVLNSLKKCGYQIISTSLQDAVDIRELKSQTKCDKPICVVLGNEAHGVSSLFLENSDYKTKIPMKSGAESLNVSVAAGIIIYELMWR